MPKRKYIISGALVFSFCLGIYTWKVSNTGLYIPGEDFEASNANIDDFSSVVYIGETPVTRREVDWEYELHTQGLSEIEELTDYPDGQSKSEPLETLKVRLMADLIERKLLFQYIRQDSEFDINNPSRYVSCLEQWQQSVAGSAELFSSKEDRKRLKDRICEKDIIEQYLKEKIFTQISISNAEVQTYFKENRKEFSHPPKATIRQIVLPSEKEAKRVYARLVPKHFEKVAREVSITPESENGGLIGPFVRGSMPSVFDVAFTMRKGEIRGILKSTYGFHIIKLEAKFSRKILSFEEAKPEIIKIIRKRKEEEEYRKWVELALNEVLIKSPRSL